MDAFETYKCYTWGGKDRTAIPDSQRRSCAICPCPKCGQPVCSSHELHGCNARKVGHDLVCARCCHPEDALTYFLIGNPGVRAIWPGMATLLRRRRTPDGFIWSRLYWVSPDDEEWRKEQAPDPANLEKRLFWSRWMFCDMTQNAPKVRKLTELEARHEIAFAPAYGAVKV